MRHRKVLFIFLPFNFKPLTWERVLCNSKDGPIWWTLVDPKGDLWQPHPEQDYREVPPSFIRPTARKVHKGLQADFPYLKFVSRSDKNNIFRLDNKVWISRIISFTLINTWAENADASWRQIPLNVNIYSNYRIFVPNQFHKAINSIGCQWDFFPSKRILGLELFFLKTIYL